MVVNFTPEQEAELSRVASQAGTDVEHLVREAAVRILLEENGFFAAVQRGIEQADRGEFIEEDEMDLRVKRMLRT